MSGRLVREVLDYAPEDLPRLELLVLLSLAESAQERDRTARYHTSTVELARRVRSTPGTVRNALGTLRGRGLVQPIHDKVKPGLAQEYRLTPLGEHHRHATTRREEAADNVHRLTPRRART